MSSVLPPTCSWWECYAVKMQQQLPTLNTMYIQEEWERGVFK